MRLLAGVAEVAEAEEGRTPDPWAAAAWAAAAAAAAAILLCTALLRSGSRDNDVVDEVVPGVDPEGG